MAAGANPLSLAPVATAYTLNYISGLLPPQSAVLEIGCGEGELALALAGAGHEVCAMDSDQRCVSACRQRGVAAEHVHWPQPLDRTFDCVIFSRSLHHLFDLPGSVAAARKTLRPGGRLILEDFCSEGPTVRSLAWYEGFARTLMRSGAFKADFDLHERLAAAEPRGGHELHSSDAIAQSLDCFAHIEAENSAYFFRYLEGHFRNNEAAAAILAHEISLIGNGVIDALGRRFVAYDS